jgi:hypothetical protein
VTDAPTDDPLDDPAVAAERLYEALAATAERPVDRHASRLLGEAEAVADDMRGCESSVIVERAAVVAELLDAVDATGDERADEAVARARRTAGRLARLEP